MNSLTFVSFSYSDISHFKSVVIFSSGHKTSFSKTNDMLMLPRFCELAALKLELVEIAVLIGNL